MILVSASSPCFTLAVPMRGVSCVHVIHTSCMGSPFPIVHAEWSRVFVENDCFKLTKIIIIIMADLKVNHIL